MRSHSHFTKSRADVPACFSPIDLLLPRLDGVKQVGSGKWLARCPAHEDRCPSLGVRETDDGKLLLKCWAGCGVEAIVAAVGLELADLFPRTDAKDFDPTAPRPKIPRYSASELLPLVVVEAMVLALAWRALAAGEALSESDRERAELAETAVVAAWLEARNG